MKSVSEVIWQRVVHRTSHWCQLAIASTAALIQIWSQAKTYRTEHPHGGPHLIRDSLGPHMNMPPDGILTSSVTLHTSPMHPTSRHTDICKINKLSPRRRRDNIWTHGGSTSICKWVRSPHMAKLQAASEPIAQSSCAPSAGTDRQTDRSITQCPPPPMARGIKMPQYDRT